jgi:hypothetical protein
MSARSQNPALFTENESSERESHQPIRHQRVNRAPWCLKLRILEFGRSFPDQ